MTFWWSIATCRRARLTVTHTEAASGGVTGGRAVGFWTVGTLAGPCDEQRARQATQLLCSSNAGMGLPYVLVPGADVSGLDRQLQDDASRRAAASPFLSSPAYLSNIARPPSVEMPGIRLQDASPFDCPPHRTW